MSEVINGSGDATQNRKVFTFTPFQGGSNGGRYEGPKAAVLAKVDQLTAAGYSVQYECDSSPIASLTFSAQFTVGSNGDPVDPNLDFTDTWDLVRNTVQKEILESDHPLVKNITADDLAILKAYMANPALDQENTLRGQLGEDINSFNACVYIFDLHTSGVKTVPVRQPILRLARLTSAIYDVPFPLDKIDKILTTSTMLSDSGVPSNFAISLTDLASQLTKSTVRPDSLVLRYGWLKDLTSENKSGQKVQYNVEWQFGLWDTALYGNPI